MIIPCPSRGQSACWFGFFSVTAHEARQAHVELLPPLGAEGGGRARPGLTYIKPQTIFSKVLVPFLNSIDLAAAGGVATGVVARGAAARQRRGW